jgi:hypothetical protein
VQYVDGETSFQLRDTLLSVGEGDGETEVVDYGDRELRSGSRGVRGVEMGWRRFSGYCEG